MKKLLLIPFVCLALVSCKKWRANKESIAIESTRIENAFDEMTNISDQAISGKQLAQVL
jgi:hypothetical protein